MFGSMWYVFVNVTISLGCIYRSAHAFSMPTILHWQSSSEMFGSTWQRLPHQVVPAVFAAFPITDSEPC
jgi:hypothetical protein